MVDYINSANSSISVTLPPCNVARNCSRQVLTEISYYISSVIPAVAFLLNLSHVFRCLCLYSELFALGPSTGWILYSSNETALIVRFRCFYGVAVSQVINGL